MGQNSVQCAAEGRVDVQLACGIAESMLLWESNPLEAWLSCELVGKTRGKLPACCNSVTADSEHDCIRPSRALAHHWRSIANARTPSYKALQEADESLATVAR